MATHTLSDDPEFEPEDKEKFEAIRKDFDEMRAELKRLRNQVEEDEAYKVLKYDQDYRYIAANSDLMVGDDEVFIKRLYPSINELEEIRRKQPPAEPEDLRKYFKGQNKVYVKEFEQDPSVIHAQIAQMKSGNANYKPFDPLKPIARFREEIPITRTDIEKFIGENLVSKLAFLFIVTGLIVGYRYSIAMGWVAIPLRIAIGSVLGAAFLAVGHYLLKEKNTFTSLMVALAVSTFYYTIGLTCYSYHLLTPIAAFWLCTIVTAVGAALALVYDRKELGFVTLLGGYLTPFIALEGGGGYSVFFWNMLAVNIWLSVVLYFRRWEILGYIANILTIVFLQSWHWATDVQDEAYYIAHLFFITLFYCLFFVMSAIYNIRTREDYDSTDRYFFFFNAVLFIITGLSALSNLNLGDHHSTFMFSVSLLYGGYIAVLYRRKYVDQDLLHVLQWFAPATLTLAIYFHFDAAFVTTLLGFESVMLLWGGIMLRDKIMKSISLYVMMLTLYSLVSVWWNAYGGEEALPFIINEGVWATILVGAALSVSLVLVTNDAKNTEYIAFIGKNGYQSIGGFLLVGVGYIGGVLELMFHMRDLEGVPGFRRLVIGAFSMFSVLVFREVVHRREITELRITTGTLMGLAVLSYILIPFQGHWSTMVLRRIYLEGGMFYPFGFHYVNVGLSVLLLYLLINDIVKAEGYKTNNYAYVIWFMAIMFVVHTSIELEHILVLLESKWLGVEVDAVLDQVRYTGLSLLWATVSFLFMFYGMRFKIKELRLVSMYLFALTILKFYAFDFWHLNPIWQIVTTIFIGLLLWIIAYNYKKRIKGLIEHGQISFDKDYQPTQEEFAHHITKNASGTFDPDELNTDDDDEQEDEYSEEDEEMGYDEDEQEEEKPKRKPDTSFKDLYMGNDDD